MAEGDRLAATWLGFDCVDMLTLDHDGLISELHIIYETATVRPTFERETGRRSSDDRSRAAG